MVTIRSSANCVAATLNRTRLHTFCFTAKRLTKHLQRRWAVTPTQPKHDKQRRNMRYFTKNELVCSCCGQHGMDEDFMAIIDGMRATAGFSFPVNSAYRCENHPIEAAKAKPGAHSTGLAIDIGVSRGQAFKVIELALSAGIKRIGVNQKGAHGRFIHLDICDSKLSPTIWSY